MVFNNNTFDSQNPYGEPLREADLLNQCVHRFSDSITKIDGQDAIIVNYFHQTNFNNKECLEIQRKLFINWTDENYADWESCLVQNSENSKGIWSMKAFDMLSGKFITGSRETYIWGKSTEILPGSEIAYLVEDMPESSFKFSELGYKLPGKMMVKTLINRSWVDHGWFPIEGRPKIIGAAASGFRGAHSMSWRFAELDAQDYDGDGLADVRLRNGSWVGYSRVEKKFVDKTHLHKQGSQVSSTHLVTFY